MIIIVSITKFSIVIGSPRAYLSHNRCVIMWVSNCRCPISTSCNRIPVIGYPRDFHVNYTCASMASFVIALVTLGKLDLLTVLPRET